MTKTVEATQSHNFFYIIFIQYATENRTICRLNHNDLTYYLQI